MPNSVCAGRRVRQPQRQPHVVRQHDDEDHRDVGEVAMHVLQHEREPALAPVARAARLADGARDRVLPERLVVGAAVVIAGEAEEARERQDQQRRIEQRQRDTSRAAGRTRRACDVAQQQRRIERREIRPVLEMLVLHRRPRAVAEERREHDDDEHWLRSTTQSRRSVSPIAARHELDRYGLHSSASERLERFERSRTTRTLARCAGTISTAAFAHSPTTVR